MGKLKVNIVDKSFRMCGPSCGTGQTGIEPVYMEWCTNCDTPITVFTDQCLDMPLSKSKYNIAWLIESVTISPNLYLNPLKYERFDYVLTHDKNLLSISKKFVFVPVGGHWIYEPDCKIHNKTKMLSIIASSKNQSVGHKLRHEVISKHKNKIDGLFGNGYQFIQNKIEGLKDYRFHIVIENIQNDYYFSEKLIDALITGCIPIYFGMDSIGNYFDKRGILSFKNMEGLNNILNTCVNEDYYNMIKKIGIIETNFQKAKEYLTPEDYMYNNLLKDLK
jgi:hypothetical protein